MKYKTKRKSHNTGFTLIEMIVTVAIVAILSSMAAPSFRGMLESNRATAEANELVSGLLLARSEALKRSNNVTLCTSTDQASCAGNGVQNFSEGWIVFQDCNDNQVLDDATLVDCGNAATQFEVIIKAQAGSNKMEVKKDAPPAGTEHYFTYKLTGRPEAVVTFEVKKPGSTTVLKEISVARTGRIKSVTCHGGTCP